MKAITPWEEGQAFDREDALDSERTRRFQQSDFPFFHELFGSQLSSRILERLEDEGWGYELNTHPQFYSDLGDQPGVKISKTLTDRGTFIHTRITTLRFTHCIQDGRISEAPCSGTL